MSLYFTLNFIDLLTTLPHAPSTIRLDSHLAILAAAARAQTAKPDSFQAEKKKEEKEDEEYDV
jgi:hypothetical protein